MSQFLNFTSAMKASCVPFHQCHPHRGEVGDPPRRYPFVSTGPLRGEEVLFCTTHSAMLQPLGPPPPLTVVEGSIRLTECSSNNNNNNKKKTEVRGCVDIYIWLFVSCAQVDLQESPARRRAVHAT
eukprot:gene9312-6551_t